eukprot:2902830-Rhodomonas_salina.1
MPCTSISATWMLYSSLPKDMARRSSATMALAAAGAGSGDPWLKGLDRLEQWPWEDQVGGEQDNLTVAVREACSLVRVVDLDSVALEPGHAEDGPHAFERQDLEDDVALVLAVDLAATWCWTGRREQSGSLTEQS